MEIDLTDKVVLITGATGNVGRATAVACREQGAKVALTGRKMAELEEMFAEWVDDERVFLVTADLMDEAAVNGMVAQVVARFGRVDGLVNVAGGFKAGTPVHETSLRDWEFMLNLNARSVFFTSRAAVPPMLAQGSGRIVNIGSQAALAGKAKMAAYSVAKTAVLRLTESMAAELKGQGITVNCIIPDTIDTPENRQAMPKADFSKWVTPQEIAEVIVWLLTEAGGAVQGAAVPVYRRG
ncbi:MAG: SDR family NAD(P)-dependent oxidoreductase [Ardenticatenaceae bacterium]|nr:SDR family NAD(P)-dependent oxidoreductase [Ardenticatenaceae bacterium]